MTSFDFLDLGKICSIHIFGENVLKYLFITVLIKAYLGQFTQSKQINIK